MSESSLSYEPLPKRIRRPRGDNPKAEESSLSSGVSSSITAPGRKEPSSNNATLSQRQVEENIQARTKIIRADATLETRDGCAGEFYEYLDHTADVQFHVWGNDFPSSLEHMALCMFNYITDISTIKIDPSDTIEFEVEAHDLESLLYNFMDELLFRFSTDGFCCAHMKIISFDRDNFKLLIKADGEKFDPTRHPQGTEIKAITYSNMQIHELPDRTDLYVIVDI